MSAPFVKIDLHGLRQEEAMKVIDQAIQKADASTIGDMAKAVQQLFGDTGTRIIGTRHGEKLYETLMTREERLRSEDMGNYFRVAADNRDLNYDKYFTKGSHAVEKLSDYNSHNTERLDLEGMKELLRKLDLFGGRISTVI